MERVPLGTIVKPIGVGRANVAENVKGKAILIEKDPFHKNVAYDDKVKRSVEVDQDAVIEHGLNARGMYLFLVARLNTDMKGTVIGDDFIIEYVQLSETTYAEYADGVEAVGGKANGMMLKKVSKSVEGRDFSYVTATAANIPLSPGLMEALKAVKRNKAGVEALWKMIDANTSISIEEYVTRLEEWQKANPNVAKIESKSSKKIAIAAKTKVQDLEEEEEDFSSENEFDLDEEDFGTELDTEDLTKGKEDDKNKGKEESHEAELMDSTEFEEEEEME